MVTNTSDVDEIVQDAFLKAWVHLSKFRFEASFRTWITRVALNESLTLYRRQRCRPFHSAPVGLESLPSAGESPYQVFAGSEVRVMVHAAIARLPAKYREVIEYFASEDSALQGTPHAFEGPPENRPVLSHRYSQTVTLTYSVLGR